MTPAARRKKAHSDLDHAIAAMEDHYKSRQALTFFQVVGKKVDSGPVWAALMTARYARMSINDVSGRAGVTFPLRAPTFIAHLRRLAPVILDMILDAEEEAQG